MHINSYATLTDTLIVLRSVPSADSRTRPHFLLLVQESPTAHKLHSVSFNQTLGPVWTAHNLYRTLLHCQQAHSLLTLLDHSFEVRQCESDTTDISTTILQPCDAHPFVFKSVFFGNLAPPLPHAYFLKCDPETSFLSSQLSYTYVLTLVQPSLML
jgi:hypothetical protein